MSTIIKNRIESLRLHAIGSYDRLRFARSNYLWLAVAGLLATHDFRWHPMSPEEGQSTFPTPQERLQSSYVDNQIEAFEEYEERLVFCGLEQNYWPEVIPYAIFLIET